MELINYLALCIVCGYILVSVISIITCFNQDREIQELKRENKRIKNNLNAVIIQCNREINNINKALKEV